MELALEDKENAKQYDEEGAAAFQQGETHADLVSSFNSVAKARPDMIPKLIKRIKFETTALWGLVLMSAQSPEMKQAVLSACKDVKKLDITGGDISTPEKTALLIDLLKNCSEVNVIILTGAVVGKDSFPMFAICVVSLTVIRLMKHLSPGTTLLRLAEVQLSLSDWAQSGSYLRNIKYLNLNDSSTDNGCVSIIAKNCPALGIQLVSVFH